MAKNAMKGIWEEKRRESERLQKVQLKKKPESSLQYAKTNDQEIDVASEAKPESK